MKKIYINNAKLDKLFFGASEQAGTYYNFNSTKVRYFYKHKYFDIFLNWFNILDDDAKYDVVYNLDEINKYTKQ